MTRTGGDRGFEIYDTRVITLNEQCGTVGATGDVKAHQDVVVRYCYRWNGAANRATCAYDGAITLRGSLGVVTGTTTPVVRPRQASSISQPAETTEPVSSAGAAGTGSSAAC